MQSNLKDSVPNKAAKQRRIGCSPRNIRTRKSGFTSELEFRGTEIEKKSKKARETPFSSVFKDPRWSRVHVVN
jgi:hypothetical protein